MFGGIEPGPQTEFIGTIEAPFQKEFGHSFASVLEYSECNVENY